MLFSLRSRSGYFGEVGHNFCFASPEIWKFRRRGDFAGAKYASRLDYENIYAVGLLFFLYVLLFGDTPSAFAASFKIDNPLKAQDFPALVEHLSTAVMKIGVPFAVAALIFGGFRFISATAAGNETKLKEARTLIVWTIVGTAVIVGGAALIYAAVNFAKTLG